MDIRSLRYFITVAELGSFTKAAALLRIAQPALSRQVQRLEDEVGMQLLSRGSRQLRLTDAGQSLLRHARTIARDFERLIEDLEARKGTPKGQIRFGIPPTLAESVIPSLVERLKRECPLITVSIVEGLTPVLAEWVQNNDIDLAILSLSIINGGEKVRGLTLDPLAQEDLIVVERAGLSSPPARYTLRALAKKPLVISVMLAEIVRNQLGGSVLDLNVALEINSVQAIKTMVLKGKAATILTVSMFKDELKAARVVGSHITSHGVRRTLTLAQSSFRQMTQATEAVARVTRAELTRLAEAGVFSLDRHSGGRRRGGPRQPSTGRASR